MEACLSVFCTPIMIIGVLFYKDSQCKPLKNTVRTQKEHLTMKLKAFDYKKYPFPKRIFWSYAIFLLAGIILLDIFAVFLIKKDATDGFIGTVISIVLTLAAFIVIWIVFALIFCALQGNKIYRGIELHLFAVISCILSPIAFIGIIAFINKAKTDYSLFNITTLFLECAVPFAMLTVLKQSAPLCKRCGLINTYSILKIQTEDLGKEHKFHNEGGYYYGQKSTGRIFGSDSETMNVEINTTHYVPKTAVYDGLFEKKRTTKDYKCSVCGNIKTEVETTETKV